MMTPELAETLTRFSALMERENAALRAMDLRTAGNCLGEKRTLMAALTELDARAAPPSPSLKPLIDRLKLLTHENKALLERALTAQNKLLAIVTTAISAARKASYDASGRLSGRTGPISLLERA
jgi:flagellar biosynthesis/type III secretory pathway chaperone